MLRKLIILAVLGLVAGGLAALVLRMLPASLPPSPGSGEVVSGKALVGGPFQLVDHTGKRVSDSDFKGRHMLVFFGFTSCPDICPSGLQVMSAALDQLGPKADRIVPLLITLDPERDTPEKLANYVKSFHPRLIALTGSLDEIKAVAKAYRVYFKKSETGSNANAYSIDHSSLFYLMNGEGGFTKHFAHTTDAGKLAEGLNTALP